MPRLTMLTVCDVLTQSSSNYFKIIGNYFVYYHIVYCCIRRSYYFAADL